MFKELLDIYLGYFSALGEPAIKIICNCSIPSQVILSEYKKLPPLSEIDIAHKKQLKQFVIDTFPTKSITEKLNCAKIIYTIGTLL